MQIKNLYLESVEFDIQQIMNIAKKMHVRSIDDIMLQLCGAITENIESRLRVKKMKSGDAYSIYEIEIPAIPSSIKAYQIYRNDTDVEYIAKQYYNMVKKHNATRKHGEDVRTILDNIELDYSKTISHWRKLETAAAGMKLPDRSTQYRERFLHKQELLSRRDISKQLSIYNKKSASEFAINNVRLLSKNSVWSGREWVNALDEVSIDDINRVLPNSKTNIKVINYVLSMGIDKSKLSEDAAEAVAAASILISACIIATRNKL